MAIWFVSRHPGAIAWARRQQFSVDHWITHLDPADLSCGDRVIGSLPVNMIADLSASGIQYWHLTLEIPEALRGQELSDDQLDALHARIECFSALRHPDLQL